MKVYTYIVLTILPFMSINGSLLFPESMDDYYSENLAKRVLIKESKKYTIEKLEKGIFEGLNKISFNYHFYKARLDRKEIIILLIPTISGVSALETNIAKFFARNGFDVLIPISYEPEISFDQNTVKLIDAGFWRPIAQTKLMLEEIRLNNNYTKTFSLGASQGGIRTIMLLDQGLNIDKAYTFVAGGDFPSLYSNTTVKQLISFRENHMSSLSLTDVNTYENYLRTNLINDPNKSCVNRTAELKMLIATKDKSVPTANQISLWKACGEPEVEYANVGHVAGVLKMRWWKKKILKFFLDK